MPLPGTAPGSREPPTDPGPNIGQINMERSLLVFFRNVFLSAAPWFLYFMFQRLLKTSEYFCAQSVEMSKSVDINRMKHNNFICKIPVLVL
mmetsp:Transcript_35315/g.69572  ORF Transcript_35315/g.69572 Transcript_35315/m.69572 type:complete len:91 (+) Transcript_35315:235-507(+)